MPRAYRTFFLAGRLGGMSALRQKRTYAAYKVMSALRPIATAKADSRKRSCLLYPPKAEMCGATRDFRFGSKANIRRHARSAVRICEAKIGTMYLYEASLMLAPKARQFTHGDYFRPGPPVELD
jgi:hypothetical protein